MSESTPFVAGTVTPAMLDHLRAIKPWVRFLSIVGFVLCGLVVCISLLMVVVLIFVDDPEAKVAAIPMLIALPLAGFIYFLPALALSRFATSLARIRDTGDVATIEQSLGYQRRFWRLIGIVVITLLSIYAVIIFVALLVGVAAAFSD